MRRRCAAKQRGARFACAGDVLLDEDALKLHAPAMCCWARRRWICVHGDDAEGDAQEQIQRHRWPSRPPPPPARTQSAAVSLLQNRAHVVFDPALSKEYWGGKIEDLRVVQIKAVKQATMLDSVQFRM